MIFRNCVAAGGGGRGLDGCVPCCDWALLCVCVCVLLICVCLFVCLFDVCYVGWCIMTWCNDACDGNGFGDDTTAWCWLMLGGGAAAVCKYGGIDVWQRR